MWSTAERLVRTKIAGHRKGLPDVPTHVHSFRVAEKLRGHGYPEEVCLAGLLHDIVEDGGVTFPELTAMGFHERVVSLVRLCSHDAAIAHKDARWVLMIASLIRANDPDAWAIKLADVLDNLGDAHAMRLERSTFMREVKAPLLLSLSSGALSGNGLWNELAKVGK